MVLALTLGLAGCGAATKPVVTRGSERLRVPGLAYWQGAEAKRLADAQCGARGVRPSAYDRYEAGTWVFVEGCA